MVDARVLQFLYPDADPLIDYMVVNDGTGATIGYWNDSVLGEQPSTSDLETIGESDEYLAWLARPSKLIELEEWWQSKESDGITPQGFEFSLGITPSDVALLNGAFTLAQTAVALGLKSSEDVFPIVDIAGNVQQLTLSQMTSALLSYGEARATLSATYAAYKAAIQSANSPAELDAISIA